MNWNSSAFAVALLSVATPALAQDGGSSGVGATVTITREALGENVHDRSEFVRGKTGSLNAIAERLEESTERRTDGVHHAWVVSLGSRLSSHLDRRQEAMNASGRTLGAILDDLARLDVELAALAAAAMAEAQSLEPTPPPAVTEILLSLR